MGENCLQAIKLFLKDVRLFLEENRTLLIVMGEQFL